MEKVTARLFKLQDMKYRDFHAKMIPNIEKEKVIGVRAPEVKKLAKEMLKNGEWKPFIRELPHQYQEENILHAYILGNRRGDIDEILCDLEDFLPYIDNWAVCDTINPKIFKKYPQEVYDKVKVWVKSEHEYTVRFGVVTLLQSFLDEHFRPEMLELAAGIHREEYYINMAIAWYFSFALIKQYETALLLIESKTLDPWVQNKSIQKAIESYRISEDQKAYLRTLKI